MLSCLRNIGQAFSSRSLFFLVGIDSIFEPSIALSFDLPRIHPGFHPYCTHELPMKSLSFDIKNPSILPTRKLTAKERRIFDRILAEFVHLNSSDAEQLTQYSEAVARYERAAKETKLRPTIDSPVVNRASGNITGYKSIRNPAFITLRESQSQANSLARRLMIDAVSTEKRQRLQSKQMQALSGREAKIAAESARNCWVSEEDVQEEMERRRAIYRYSNEDVLRQEAIWYLTVCLPLLEDPEGDEDIYVQPA